MPQLEIRPPTQPGIKVEVHCRRHDATETWELVFAVPRSWLSDVEHLSAWYREQKVNHFEYKLDSLAVRSLIAVSLKDAGDSTMVLAIAVVPGLSLVSE